MIEQLEIKIENNVPMPNPKKHQRKYGNYANVIKSLKVGDSFAIYDEVQKELFRTTAYQVKPQVRITSKKTGKNEWRIWRIE